MKKQQWRRRLIWVWFLLLLLAGYGLVVGNWAAHKGAPTFRFQIFSGWEDGRPVDADLIHIK